MTDGQTYNPDGFLNGVASDDTANANTSWYNDYTLKNTHFLRLKNIRVTYNLPEKILSEAKINSASVYLDREFCPFTNYEGLDPRWNRTRLLFLFQSSECSV